MILSNLIWPKEAFKNFLALFVLGIMFYLLYIRSELRDSMFVLITLVIKHYFDSTSASNRKDDTINSMASSIPNVDKTQEKEVKDGI